MMKSIYIGWFLSLLAVIGSYFYVSNIKYFINDTGQYMTLLDYDTRISAMLSLSAIFFFLVYTILIIVKQLSPSLLNKRIFVHITMLPIYPIVSGALWIALDLVISNDNVDYFNRGIHFANANIGYFSNSLTMNELISIGRSLHYGIGIYITSVIFILLLIHQIIFTIKYNNTYYID
ncbi:MAG: hypothetical protein KQ78_01659 [Candidatus Izimaplasma bacterium HR2]|nr:MAG: hypothetical protein KQ78_01659 [Candidatus Izimaplasma bacterium HR2]